MAAVFLRKFSTKLASPFILQKKKEMAWGCWSPIELLKAMVEPLIAEAWKEKGHRLSSISRLALKMFKQNSCLLEF